MSLWLRHLLRKYREGYGCLPAENEFCEEPSSEDGTKNTPCRLCRLTDAVLKERPETSLAGIVIALLSLVVMPILTKLKYDVGIQIGSKALIADAKETLACAFLSLALLLGLGLNYIFGFWQADPIVGMIIVLFLLHEGYEVWEEAGEEGEDERSQ